MESRPATQKSKGKILWGAGIVVVMLLGAAAIQSLQGPTILIGATTATVPPPSVAAPALSGSTPPRPRGVVMGDGDRPHAVPAASLPSEKATEPPPKEERAAIPPPI